METTVQNSQELDLLQFAGMHLHHAEELARVTGEHFNIFNVLGIGHREVKTHSPILAELLNPDGCHGQGDKFLKLFVSGRHFNVTGFGTGKSTVEQNYYAGPVTENSGGFIDILIKNNDSGATIVIENKIYALDGENQMKRYRGSFPKARLLYLTLDGRPPSNLSPGELNDIKCDRLSYAKHIVMWLEDCRKESACLPNVREIITQYIHLIEMLTGRSTITRMNTELINEIIADEKKLRAFFALTAEQYFLQQELLSRLDKQLDTVAAELKLKRQGSMKDGSCFFIPEGAESQNLQIGFEWESKGWFFGIWYKDCPSQFERQLLEAFQVGFPGFSPKPASFWPAWDWFESPYRSWNAEAASAIVSGTFGENLKVKLKTMAEIASRITDSSNQ